MKDSMIFCYRRLLHSSLGHGRLAVKGLGVVGVGLVAGSLSEGSLSVLLSVLLSKDLSGLGLRGSLLGLVLLQR